MTTITTTNPVRSDVVAEPAPARTSSRQSRLWALSGIGSALLGIGTIVTSSAVAAVYDPSLTTPEQIKAELYVSNKTVRNAVSSIYAKLHAGGRAEAIAKARDAGMGRPST